MKIGQPKLSVRKAQRNGLFVGGDIVYYVEWF
jgi:hypothetical protein